jgi:hypothetical protein
MLWEGLLEVEPDCQSQIPMVAGEGLGLALELLTFLFRRVTCKVVFLGSFS